jgi:tRNA C32,U32 (ribose-2'-O)-methylase TrmJ
MEDRTHSDVGQKARAIIDDAIAELLLLGMESRDQAAKMMACQAVLRIEDNDVVKEVEIFVHESIWDVDDTNDQAGGGD